MEKLHLKYNVISQWIASSGIMSVQAVELAKNETQQLMGGDYAVRVCFLDSQTRDQTMCFTLNAGAAKEFCELMAQAILSIVDAAEGK